MNKPWFFINFSNKLFQTKLVYQIFGNINVTSQFECDIDKNVWKMPFLREIMENNVIFASITKLKWNIFIMKYKKYKLIGKKYKC